MKPTIVLVHGSWHWGGCFHKLEKELVAKGYRVRCPDLAGHGDDETKWYDVDSLDTYIANVRKEIEQADGQVTLVGHSMAGVTLTYLGETMPAKISKLVYLAAFMTPAGATANDYILAHRDNPISAPLNDVISPVHNGSGLQLASDKPDRIKECFYGDCSTEDFVHTTENATLINPIVANVYSPAKIPELDRYYIQCTNDRAVSIDAQREMCADAPGATVFELASSHSPFYSMPEKLAEIIEGLT